MKLKFSRHRRQCCYCVTVLLLLFSSLSPSFAQTKKAKESSWWLGIAGGANFNAYKGNTGALNVDVNVSPGFSKGHGVGGYYALVAEYRPAGAAWGLMLQEGGDGRRAEFKTGDKRLTAKIGYFTIEPALLIMPFKKPVYFYAGPRLGLLWHTGFTYQAGNGPEYPQKNINPPAYIKNLDKIEVSIHVGIGYNISVHAAHNAKDLIVSPFITYLPSLGNNLRTMEKLELNTIRAGLILKTGL